MGKNKLSIDLNNHIRDNIWLYIVSMLCLFTGLVLGIYTVKYMGDMYRSDLVSYLNSFTDYLSLEDVNSKAVFMQTMKNNFVFISAIWFLGMTMIGVPLILVIDVIKGYTIGFTISFMINSIGIKGIWMALLGVIPQNIVYIPCIILASVLSMEFSLNFLRERVSKQFISNIWMRIASYSVLFIIVMFVMVLGFFLEAYVTPNVIKLVVINNIRGAVL